MIFIKRNLKVNNKAKKYYTQGYSCSESIIKAAIDEGLVSKEFLPAATAFSGGMGSGCICGAVAASQMVIGALNGKTDEGKDGLKARELAKKFVEEFKAKNKFTCCKALTAGLAFGSPERKENCSRLVDESATIVKTILELDKQRI